MVVLQVLFAFLGVLHWAFGSLLPLNESAQHQLPPGLQHQTKAESHYLDLHKCRDHGEAYSAAYLTTTEHLLTHNTHYNLTWVNCEMASFIMMNSPRAEHKADSVAHGGQVVQALDVLGFSVIHLSAYERLLRRHKKGQKQKFDAIKEAIRVLKQRAQGAAAARKANDTDNGFGAEGEVALLLSRTVAFMPFLGSDMGAGHSDLSNRYLYLQACVWSLYIHFEHIVVFVKHTADYEYVMRDSGLPVYQVHVLEGLPKSASLPVGSVQATKQHLVDGDWDFDYVYFTESDQILMVRDWVALYGHLQHYRRRMVVPHRLMPYPEEVLHTAHHKPTSTMVNPTARSDTDISNDTMLQYKCCMPRQNCVERKTWVPLRHNSVPVLRVHGLAVPLGNSNFHLETYRPCSMLKVPSGPPPLDRREGGGSNSSDVNATELVYVVDSTGVGGKYYCP